MPPASLAIGTRKTSSGAERVVLEPVGPLRQDRVGRAKEGQPERSALHPRRALARGLRLDQAQDMAALQ